MSDQTRQVRIVRTGRNRYRATNRRGATLDFGTGDDTEFTPVELLLAAMAGCSAIDVDLITSKRTEPDRLSAVATGDKLRDEHGNHMANLIVTLQATFPPGEAGDAARERLPRAVAQSHDRLCTVIRTVELGTPVTILLAHGSA